MSVNTCATVQEILRAARSAPAGVRSARAVARTTAAGLQPVRNAMPQFLPDFLAPENGTRDSFEITHLCVRPVSPPPHCHRASQSQPQDPEECNAKRFAIMRALDELANDPP